MTLADPLKARRAKTDPSEGQRSKGGRPTADRAAAISREIMAAATRIFLAEGYEGASMEAVAAAAGVPKPTLYKRYPDKKALLRAVLREQVAAWAPAEEELQLGDDLEARLKHHAAAMLARATTPEVAAYLALVASAWSGPEEAESRREAIGATEMVSRLIAEIREYGPRSGIHAQRPEEVALLLMSTLAGWTHYTGAAAAGTPEDAVRFAHRAVELLMHGSARW